MVDSLILLALLLAIVLVGALAVLVYDAVELVIRQRREQRVRADVRRGPWAPR